MEKDYEGKPEIMIQPSQIVPWDMGLWISDLTLLPTIRYLVSWSVVPRLLTHGLASVNRQLG